MTGEQLKGVISGLPSYEEWSEKISQLKIASNQDLAVMRNASKVGRAEIGLGLATAEEALKLPHAHLLGEIAEARTDLDLPYRLGTLAIFDNPERRLLSENRVLKSWIRLTRQPIWTNDDIGVRDYNLPSNNPYDDAARLGALLAGTERSLRRYKYLKTPLAELRLGRRRLDLVFPTRAEYFVVPVGEKGLDFEEPQVDKTTEYPSVKHDMPLIQAKLARFDTKKQIISDKNLDSRATIAIPAVNQLQGHRTEVKLLFGVQAVWFAQKQHARDKAEQRRHLIGGDPLDGIRLD